MNRAITDEWFDSEGEKPAHDLILDEDMPIILPIPNKYYIYFIIEGVGGAIKIGRAKDVFKRLQTLQTGNSKRLRMLAYTREIKELKETKLHLIFDKYHIHGEWFLPTPEVFDFITRVRWQMKDEITRQQLADHTSRLYKLKLGEGVDIKP